MNDSDRTHPLHPSKRSILRASGVALGGAVLVLLIAVLPAEFGIDPTGLGGLLRFTRLHSMKAMQGNALSHRSETREFEGHTIVLRFAPGQTFEYKFTMRPGQVLLYSWSATDSVQYRLHGEMPDDHSGAVTDYEGGTGITSHGSLTAQFDGLHGWAWLNPTTKNVDLTLRYDGYFEDQGVIGAPDSVLVRRE